MYHGETSENHIFAMAPGDEHMIKAIVNTESNFHVGQNSEELFFLEGMEGKYHIVSSSPYELIIKNDSTQFQVFITKADPVAKTYTLKISGKKFEVKMEDRLDLLLNEMGFAALANQGVSQLKAPMPGLILEISGEKGMQISKGDKLLVLEAMKMENVIKSPADGIISNVLVNVGDSVNKNQILIQFE
jgi:biotin carboxyl carrier protein